MKITVSQLRKIIKEEVQRSLREDVGLMQSHVDEIEFRVDRAQELGYEDYLLNKLNGKPDSGEGINYIEKNQLDGAAGLLMKAGLRGPGLTFDNVLDFVQGDLQKLKLDPTPGPTDPGSTYGT